MRRIGQQPVGDVQPGAGVAAQQGAQCQLRQRPPEALVQVVLLGHGQACGQGLPQYDSQAGRAVPQAAADTKQVTGPRAAAGQRQGSRHLTKHRHTDIQRATRGIAADQVDTTITRRITQAGRERLQPARFGLRQGQRQGKAQRLGRHGSEIADGYGKSAVTQFGGRAINGEVNTLDQGVGRYDQLLTSSRLQQRSIVADAQGDRPAGCSPLQSLGAKVAGNQVKLVQRHGRAISVPCGRR